MAVIELDAHENMTPKEALAKASREQWDDLIVVGYQHGELYVRSSKMTRRDALWIAQHLILHVLRL